jgi:hypothetical protein
VTPASMKRLSLLALVLLVLTGCSSMQMPGSALYLANRPDGDPFLRVTSGLGGPMLAVNEGATWTPPKKMEPMKLTEPPITLTPGLADILKAAYRIDSYQFLEFKPDAVVAGKTLPSRYYLMPGGFAYVVPAPKAPGH